MSDPAAPAIRRRPRGARTALAIVLALAVAALALVAYAAPRIGLPWRGGDPAVPEPDAFDALVGSVTAHGEGLRVQSDAPSGQALVAAAVDVDAAAYRFVRYRIDGVPRSLRVAFGWRTAAEPGRWRWAPLPFPRGTQTVDLARLTTDWDGRIVAIALLLLPSELLPAHALPPRDVRVLDLRLERDAYAPATAALLDEWRAYHPWSGRSINTAGFALGQHEPRPLLPWVAVLAALLLVAVGLARRWPWAGWLRAAVLAAGAAWMLLDLAQLQRLSQRALHLHDNHRLAAGALAIQPALTQVLADIAALPALRERPRRLAVVGGNAFLGAYPVYALAPHDAAAVRPAALPEAAPGTLVLSLGGSLEYRGGAIWIDGAPLAATLLHEQGPAQLFELRPAAEGDR